MTLLEAITATLKTLPPEKQQEVLDFAEFLSQKFYQAAEQPSPESDLIWDLGTNPVQLGLPDAAENHDQYLYNSGE